MDYGETMALCACGCGKETLVHRGKPNRYIVGHVQKGRVPWNKGIATLPETKEKIRLANLGKIRPEEVKIKISNTMKHAKINVGIGNPAKRPEVREKISRSVHSYFLNHIEQARESNKKGGKTRERKWRNDGEYREKMLAAIRDIEVRRRISESLSKYQREHPDEVREKNKRGGETRKLLWKDPAFAQKMFKAQSRRPNRVEEYLDYILETNFPGEWKYVGDGKLWIEGKNPDFINCNGKKLIIEYNGFSFSTRTGEHAGHTRERDEAKTKIYADYGYKTLNLYKKDLTGETALVEKIRIFIS